MTGSRAELYTEQGYRTISRTNGIIARVDREDWLEYMRDTLGYVLNYDDNYADYYRRKYSKDRLEVSEYMARLIPNSTNDTTGFIPLRNWVPMIRNIAK